MDESLIDKIIELSDKYLYDRNQPDKSIDVLDEVCSKVSLKETKQESKLNELYNLLQKIINTKNECIINNNFEEAYKFKGEEESITTEINNLELTMSKTEIKVVTEEDIKEVISSRTKMPILNMVNKDNKHLIEIERLLKDRILGQDNAIEELIKITKRIQVGLKDKNFVSLLFCGPTGVGKTELAKAYGEALVGIDNVIKLDMSEFSEAHSISKIIGAPPGYVGYDDNKNILEEIRCKPNSIIILDEIERCHKSILNVFLQILDDGKVKDAKGKYVRFDNSIIIMTTNIGFDKNSVGFNSNTEANVLSKLKSRLGVEFINRIYNTMIFNKLSKNIIAKITKKELDKLKEVFYNIDIKIEKNAIESIIELSNYKEFGARKINKVIKDNIENLIIDAILNNEDKIVVNNITKKIYT
jgi:ATP-dependent Clp protease ATP-binding subunit ClpC